MKRIIRIIFLVIGAIIGLYGTLNDYEPVTIMSALLLAVGLMLPVWMNFNKE